MITSRIRWGRILVLGFIDGSAERPLISGRFSAPDPSSDTMDTGDCDDDSAFDDGKEFGHDQSEVP